MSYYTLTLGVNMKKFDQIKSRNELADYLGISRKSFSYLLYKKQIDDYYEVFEIPKKNGELRPICAPRGLLKKIQKKLSDCLSLYQEDYLYQNRNHSISHGFIKKKSIITNSVIHRNKRYVLNIDLKDFFTSFHFGRVVGYFEKNKHFQLPHEVAVVIAQLVCYKGVLPQGAPTSPVITNLIGSVLDYRISKIAQKYRLDYTRYADDLAFSTNDYLFEDSYQSFLNEITLEIEKSGFSINEKKLRLQYKDSQQKVTGLVVNKRINVDREYYKKTRAMSHSLYKTGEFLIDGEIGTFKQLEGRYSFIYQLENYSKKIDPKNKLELSNRNEDYRKLLFYHCFLDNEKPLLVTEGKTDVLYIKAALKAYYTEYPLLIEKDKDGNFIFKIEFLKRSKRLMDLFSISTDGADTLKNVYNLFVGKGNLPNLFRYFYEKYGKIQRNPIILIFDNEQISERPLKKFLAHVKLIKDKKQEFDLKTAVKLVDNTKLFLVTMPLLADKKELEMEDLFGEDVLKHEINGKLFSRSNNYDSKVCYGKNEFSKYIYKEYEKIDFSGFKPMLDKICEIIQMN